MTRYGPTFLLLCSTESFIKSSTNLHIYWSTSNVSKYIAKLWTNGHYHDLYLNECDAYGTLSGESLLALCKEGTYTNTSKNVCASVKILKCETHDDENVKVGVNDYLIKKIDVNIKQCRKIDEFVKTGDLIKVVGYKKLKASMIVRCTINDETQAKDYIATYWLKQTLNDYLKNNTKHLNLMVGTFKTTPQKQKALLYVEG